MSSTLIHVAGLDVERGYEDGFDCWYESDFLPETLSRPGWTSARRYRCLDGEPGYLTIFELGQEALGGPFPAPFRFDAVSRRIRDYGSGTWRRVFEAGADPAAAELINLIKVEVEPDHLEGFDRWYSTRHAPEIIACPGWLGCQRYRSLDGGAKVLAIYGLADREQPFSTPEYESVVGWEEHVDHIRGYHGFRIYRLIEEAGDPT